MINQYIPASALAGLVEDDAIVTKAPGLNQHAPIGLIVEFGDAVRLVVPDGTPVAHLRTVGEQLCALGQEDGPDETKPDAKKRTKSQGE